MSTDLHLLPEDAFRPLLRREYDELVRQGAFVDDKIELLHGRLVRMTPTGHRHNYAHRKLNGLLARLLPDGFELAPASSFAASDDSEPEPDLAVLQAGDYLDDHATTAALIIEVSDSSLRRDRLVKAPMYAAAGVPEYWIVNVRDGVVERYLDPHPDGYGTCTRCGREGSLTPVMLPRVSLRVADFMPPVDS